MLFEKEPELLLIHGPPGIYNRQFCANQLICLHWLKVITMFYFILGTGKTKPIVGLIIQLIKVANRPIKPRLLICTPSNTALDEIMVRLEQEGGGTPELSVITSQG
jgi:superfamily I DNA and/or RNA helicase